MNDTRQDLINRVIEHSVIISGENINRSPEMRAWCVNNVGEQRLWHPIREASDGHSYSFPGAWAITDAGFWSVLNSGGGLCFWFEKKHDLVQFQLTWL